VSSWQCGKQQKLVVCVVKLFLADCVVDFDQVVPVLVTRSLLERMRNNFMVIEVWDKKTSALNDQVLSDDIVRVCF